MLFDSLQKKIKGLDNNIIMYPGHGPGSACGKDIGPESQSTIGHQKLHNYALKISDKDEFIMAVTSDLPSIPGYFFKDARVNREGYGAFDDVVSKVHGLSIDKFNAALNDGAIILDTRSPVEFANGFIKHAINIGLNGDFAVWTGTFIAPDASILLVSTPGTEREAVERLARIGYDNIRGYLGDSVEVWSLQNGAIESVIKFIGKDLAHQLTAGGYELLDVRNRKEVAKDHIAGSVHIPLNQLSARYTELSRSKKWLIYCAGGYRSMIAASFLKSNDFEFVASIDGGINHVRESAPELIETGLETE